MIEEEFQVLLIFVPLAFVVLGVIFHTFHSLYTDGKWEEKIRGVYSR